MILINESYTDFVISRILQLRVRGLRRAGREAGQAVLRADCGGGGESLLCQRPDQGSNHFITELRVTEIFSDRAPCH